MNNINDTSFFDYLDGLLSPEDKKEFENYIANNPEAKSKLDKLIQEETSYYNKVDAGQFEKITDKYSFEINKLQEIIDKQHKKEPKKNNLLDFVKNMFLPLWQIPIQAKSVVVALPVGAYLFVTSFAPMQVAQNQSSDDFFTQLANLNDYQEFLPNSEYGNSLAVNLNNQSWNIENITTNLKMRSAAQASELTCGNLDSKIIEISPTDNPLNKKTLTYCSEIDKNNWRLLNIKIINDKKPLNLNSNYKLTFEKDSIYLFPEYSD